MRPARGNPPAWSSRSPATSRIRARFHVSAALVGVCFSVLSFPAFAVDSSRPFSHYVRTHFTTDDGLPASVVDHIQQTPDGFLWLILNGNYLTRFDGRQFHGFDGIVATTIAAGPNGDL